MQMIYNVHMTEMGKRQLTENIISSSAIKASVGMYFRFDGVKERNYIHKSYDNCKMCSSFLLEEEKEKPEEDPTVNQKMNK